MECPKANSVTIGHVSKEDHVCQVEQSGDWIVFTCPHCADYERSFNVLTGEMQSHGVEGNPIKHHGNFIKPGLDVLRHENN